MPLIAGIDCGTGFTKAVLLQVPPCRSNSGSDEGGHPTLPSSAAGG
jgi:hypothetical protein